MSQIYRIAAYSPWSKGGSGEFPSRVVILRWQDAAHEWSTHLQLKDGRDFPTFIWGHYFTLYDAALLDAEERVRVNNAGMTPEHECYISHFIVTEV